VKRAKIIVWLVFDREESRYIADGVREGLSSKKIDAQIEFFSSFQQAAVWTGASPDFMMIDIASITSIFGFHNPWGFNNDRRLTAFCERHSSPNIAFFTEMGSSYTKEFTKEAKEITGRSDLHALGGGHPIEEIVKWIMKYSSQRKKGGKA
jgi:hypothetical protein